MQRSFKVRADQRPRLCPTCPHGMPLSHPRWLTIWTSSCGFWPPPRMTVGLRSMIPFHCGLWEIHSTWNRHEDIALSSWIIYKYPLSGSDGRVCLQCQRPGFDPWVRKIPWRRKSSILAWRIPWTEEPGGLQSMWSQRVRQDWVTSTFFFILPTTHSNSAHLSKPS